MPKNKFLRREFHKRKKLKATWRKPKGFHSKVRRKERHASKMPTSSIRTPKTVRGKHPSGMIEKVVMNMSDLKNARKEEIIRIASKVGRRKRLQILETAKKMKFRVIGAKDIDAAIKAIQDKFGKRKAEKQKKKSEKAKKAKMKAKETDDVKTKTKPTSKGNEKSKTQGSKKKTQTKTTAKKKGEKK